MRYLLTAVLAVSLGLSACGNKTDQQTADEKAADGQPAALDEAGKIHYSIGHRVGSDLKNLGVEARPDAILQGFEDAQSGTPGKLTDEEMRTAMMGLSQRAQRAAQQRAEEQRAEAEKALVESQAFLAENAGKEGVQTTASGLQYRIVEEGTGKSPTTADTVTVHYRGTRVDGTEFDSSYSRGQPATFPLQGLIAGWTEALPMMKEGAKWQLFVPPDLAYGDQGPLANRALIFDIELISVEPAK